MAFELPKSKREWIVFWGWLVFITLSVYLDFLNNVDPLSATDKQSLQNWVLRITRDVSLAIGLGGTTILSIRSIRESGFRASRILSLSFSILFFLFLSGAALFGHITMSKIQRDLFHTPYSLKENIKEYLDCENLPLSQRSEISLIYARRVWEETGEALQYITIDGKEKTYEPSLEEIETRNKRAKTEELVAWTLKGLKRAYILWPLIAVLSIAMGLFSPIGNKKRTN
jgi:hypothetical protein